MSSSMIFFLVLLVIGVIVLAFSRTLKRLEEEKWKEEFLFREVLYGPRGYYRAVAAMLGIVMIVIGVLGTLWMLLPIETSRIF